ncbi:hypothetical protein ABZ714_01240 [Streptomyces sp. NPDC006798]|uniref:hypothetical protein n=1 Tax=Streptomyces sp. NPDC006798 TaxID=3155462 RepID=UPI003404B344
MPTEHEPPRTAAAATAATTTAVTSTTGPVPGRVRKTSHDSATASSNAGALRVLAGVGLVLLIGAAVLAALLALLDAFDGDGRAGPLVAAGLSSLVPAGLLGMIAAAVPRDDMPNTVRGRLVLLQYACTILAPALVAADA